MICMRIRIYVFAYAYLRSMRESESKAEVITDIMLMYICSI